MTSKFLNVCWLTIISTVSKTDSYILHVEDDASAVIFKSRMDGNSITKQQFKEFKVNHGLSDDLDLSFQEISMQNTFSHNGKDYELYGELEEIFDPEATYTHNGIPGDIPATNVFRIEDRDDIVMVTEKDGEVGTIMITNKENGDATFLESIVPGVLVSIESEDHNLGGLERRSLELRREISNTLEQDRQMERLNVCSSFRQIDLAIAYESSFCAEYGGDKATADDQVQSLISMVSSKYQQEGLCIKVKLSHLEGYCDPTIDPYKQYVDLKVSGCTSVAEFGVLDGLMELWNTERTEIRRDVVQLFTGTTLECFDNNKEACVKGCANKRGSTCKKKEGYAINYLTYTKNPAYRTTIVAHEMGHNNGAKHFAEKGHVMYESVGLSLEGFSIDSINAFNSHFSLTSCIGPESAAFYPTRSPTNVPTVSPNKVPGSGTIDCKTVVERASRAVQYFLRPRLSH